MIFVLTTVLSITSFEASAADPKRSDFLSQLLDEGIAFERAGNFKDALNRFNTMLVVDPNNAEAHYRIGLLYASKNDTQKALKYMKKATELSPKNIRLAINLGQQYERYEMLDDAIAEYQRIISTGVRDPRIKEAEKLLALASSQSLVKKGEINAALLVLNGLMLEYSEDPAVMFGVSGVYVLLNRIEEAERVMKKLLEKQPDNDLVHINLANVYERTGRLQEAMKEFKFIIDRKQSEQAVTMATFRYGILEGKENYRQGKWQEALKSFDDLLKIDPKFKEAIFNRALVFLQLKQIDVAEKIFAQLIEMSADDYSARLNLASLLGSTQRIDKALEQYDYIIKNDKEGRYKQQARMRANIIHSELGNAAASKKDFEAALKEYSIATQYYGGFATPWYNRGLVLLQINKKQEAIQEFIQVIGVEPANVEAHARLAEIYLDLNRFSDAAAMFDAIARIDPNSQKGRVAIEKLPLTKAKGLWTEKKYTEAQDEFEHLLTEQPGNYDAWYYLGAMTDERGRLNEAANYMQKAIALRPNEPQPRMYLANLYERLEMEELAEDEYRRVLFMGVNPALESDVLERLGNVEAVLSGFSRRLLYSANYDSNAGLNDLAPSSEVNTSLTVNVTYANKFADDLRFNFQFNPTYLTYHKNNFDVLQLGMQYSMVKGSVDRNWSLAYSDDMIIDVDSSASTSNTGGLAVRNSRRVYWPALFGLAPEGLEDEKQPTGVDLFFSLRDYESKIPQQPLKTLTPSFGINATQTLVGGVSASVSYSVSLSRVRAHSEYFEQQGDYVSDRFSGQTQLINQRLVKVFDSDDFEFDLHSVSFALQRMLRPGLRGSISATLGYNNYINPDTTHENERRRNYSAGLRFNFAYFVQKDISLIGALDWNKTKSNLETGAGVDVRTNAESQQVNTLGGYTKFTSTLGVQMVF